MKFLATCLSALSAASLAAAHGYVDNGTIGGVSYTFYQPYEDPYISPSPSRISRPIQGNGPVTDLAYLDLQCGGDTADGVVGSSPAALHAPATAGSDVTLYWTLWPSSHYGAMITYMARCPDSGCTDFMPNKTAVWFKVKEGGLIDKATDEWADTVVMTAGNAGYTYTIPECLETGFYLVRHEIVTPFTGPTQIYPGCHQLNITASSGSTVVTDNLVAFPGAYKSDTPGITWDSSESTYPIPGPSVFTCGGDSAAATATSAAAATATTAATTAAVASSSSAAHQTPSTLSSQAQVAYSASSASFSAPAVVTPAAVVTSSSAAAYVAAPAPTSSSAAAPVVSSSAKTCNKKKRRSAH